MNKAVAHLDSYGRRWRTKTHGVLLVAAWLMAVFLLGTAGLKAQEVPALGEQSTVNLVTGQGRLLRFKQQVESVFVADTAIADVQVVSPGLVYVFGRKAGKTNLIAITGTERMEASTQLRVTNDVTPAIEAQRALRPNSPAVLSIFGNRIVASGETQGVEDATDIDNIARTFSPSGQPPLNVTTIQGSQQVNIRVRFAEVSRSELQSFGVDWSVGYRGSGFEFNLFQSNGIGSSGGGNFGASLSKVHGVNFDILLEALQRNGIVKILAEPNLTAVTGQTASFLAGGEIPVPIPQGRDIVTVQYKPFGVSLGFTPTLVGRNRIALHVQPEVSALSEASSVNTNGFAMPSFVVRKADTTVEVASGQTFAIAGLFQQRMSRNLQKFPVLGDVPVLGALFQSQRFQREETELVILITPYLVQPVRGTLASPQDRPAKRRNRGKEASSTGLIIK